MNNTKPLIIVFFISMFLFPFSEMANSQNVDSLFTIYITNKGANHKQIGDEIVNVLKDNKFDIDSTIYNKDISLNEREVIITRMVMQYQFKRECYQSSINAGKHLVDIAEKNFDTAQIVAGYYYMGYASQRGGHMDDALKYNIHCYDLACKQGDMATLSSVLNNLGNVYLTNGESENAIRYFQQSIDIENQLGRKGNLAVRKGNISTAYMKLGQFDDALKYAKEGLALDEELGKPDKVAIRHNQLGNIYMKMEQYDKALEQQQEALDYFAKNGSIYGQAITLHAVGEIHDLKGNDRLAIKYYEESLKLAKKLNNSYITEQIYNSLYCVNRDSDPAKALAYYEQYTALKDSIFNEENKNRLAEFDAKYDASRKQAQIEEQEQALAFNHKRMQLLIMLIILALICVLLMVVITILKQRRNRALQQLNELKDRMLTIFSHDLKNSTLSQKIALHQVQDNLDILSKDDLKTIVSATTIAADTQVLLLENLLQWTRMLINKLSFTPIIFLLDECVKNNVKLFDNILIQRNIHVVTNIPEGAMANSDRNMISTILRNLINNAIKFSEDSQNIDIDITDKGDKWLVSVADHGCGMDEKTVKGILEGDKETTSGLGLMICRNLTSLCGETLSIESTIGKGSVFSITIRKG